MTNFALLALLCIAFGVAVMRREYVREELLLAVQGEDEDMKIVGEHFPRPAVDTAESAAREFLKQKQSGNIERARELGKLFARAVLDVESGPLAGEMSGKPMQMQHHLYLLYTYVVNRVIAEFSPDSILAQTSLNVFYSEIEGASPALYTHVSDMAAFSLYILCERSKNRTDDEIGRIFADLCGLDNQEELIAYGNTLFGKFYNACAEKIGQIPYNPVE